MYEKFKNWVVDRKTPFIISLGFIIMFFLGFGLGVYEKSLRRDKIQKYNSKNPPKTTDTAQTTENQKAENTEGNNATSTDKTCLIKGNISSQNKIYHLPGGAFYNIVQPEQCFQTEAEAQKAGFRKSSR